MLDFAIGVSNSILWLLQEISWLATWYEFVAIGLIDVTFTVLASLTIGRTLARHSKILAAIVCGLLVPLALCIAAKLALMAGPEGTYTPDGNVSDGPAMIYVGFLTLALLSVPLSLLASTFVVSRFPGRKQRELL